MVDLRHAKGKTMSTSLINGATRSSAKRNFETLRDRIGQREARVVIMGGGYVGLTLAVEAARTGFHVTCFEIDRERAFAINNGESQVPGIGDEELGALVNSGSLVCGDMLSLLQGAEVIIICVATPLNTSREPDTSQITAAAASISHCLEPGTLVVLESTTYPGTTEELVKPVLEATGLKAEQDFWLGYSPERVDPGNKHFGMRNTPKIVSGVGPQSLGLVEAFYETMADSIVPVSSPAAAELVKLYENIFRNINIAFANEMALLCDHMKLDIWEIIHAASTKPYGFMPFYPGPGPGGHCIPVDPHYLSWKARQHDFHCKFIELASSINDDMPRHVLGKVSEALNLLGKPIRDSLILVLGVAYKPDIGDTRESAALRILPLLEKQGAQIAYHDPHVQTLHMLNPGDLESTPLTPEILGKADCVVILTDHSSYPYEEIVEQASLVVDCRNALGKRGICGRATVLTL